MKTSIVHRNACLDALETALGTSAKLRIYTGSAPTNCEDAASGTLLCTIDLPSDYLAAASVGSKAKSGTWTGTAAATGTAGYYRLWDSGITTCHAQGAISELGLNTTSINSGQTVTISTWTATANNA